MIHPDTLLIKLVLLIDKLPQPKQEPTGGRPLVYPETLFLKALVIMTLRQLYKPGEFLAVLEQPTMQLLKTLLVDNKGRFPCRRTWERRLARLPESLPQRIGLIGRTLVAMIEPWRDCGRAVALDSTVLHASGGVWHKKHREKDIVPHSRIDTEANWTKSGWHGWVYGWKLHLAVTVASVWIPLAVRLGPANEADNNVAELLIPELPHQTRFVLGDLHYNAPNVKQACRLRNLFLVTTQYGPYPHKDAGAKVRSIFHKLRSVANENFNEQFKAIFNGHDRVPTKGLVSTQRYALGAVLVYQLVLWQRHEQGLPLRRGLKPYIKAA